MFQEKAAALFFITNYFRLVLYWKNVQFNLWTQWKYSKIIL